MLLGDAHVKIAIGEVPGKPYQPRTLTHGRRDGHQAIIMHRTITNPVGKHLGVGLTAGAAGTGLLTSIRIKRPHTVIDTRVTFCRREPPSLLRNHVQKTRTFHLFHVAQGLHHQGQIMAVDGSNIVESQFFEQGAGDQHALHVLFPAIHEVTHARHDTEDILAPLTHAIVETAGKHPRQIIAYRTDRIGDGHVVVIEYHQQIHIQGASMIQRLEGHTRRQGAIANNGNVLPLYAF